MNIGDKVLVRKGVILDDGEYKEKIFSEPVEMYVIGYDGQVYECRRNLEDKEIMLVKRKDTELIGRSDYCVAYYSLRETVSEDEDYHYSIR